MCMILTELIVDEEDCHKFINRHPRAVDIIDITLGIDWAYAVCDYAITSLLSH